MLSNVHHDIPEPRHNEWCLALKAENFDGYVVIDRVSGQSLNLVQKYEL